MRKNFNIECYLKQMSEYGVRRLWVISGRSSWCYQQANQLKQQITGDWLWLGQSDEASKPVAHYHLLLGREFKHAIFDATLGFHAEAFAALAGTLVAGSLLVLLIPPWDEWAQHPDQDSIRWDTSGTAMPTPNFIHHVQQQLLADLDVLLLFQNGECRFNKLAGRMQWSEAKQQGYQAQQRLLEQLLNVKSGIYAIIAPRGRGKSALAGQLAHQWHSKEQCLLTAPNKQSVTTLMAWAKEQTRFIAPDELLHFCQSRSFIPAEWLIVDEAAMIPMPILYQLVTYFPRVLLTTTVNGYEGTGRGFLLKFCDSLPGLTKLSLNYPIRWAQDDPLEGIVNQLLLFQDEEELHHPELHSPIKLTQLNAVEFTQQPHLLAEFYSLLTSAHYRTTPLDLRRLLDAKGMHFSVAQDARDRLIAGVWCVEEGGLEAKLARSIWLGKRRPRGNLVAQSLVAHAGEMMAAILTSRRVSRIVVEKHFRHRGIASALILQQQQEAKRQGLDYLSVSFGFHPDLLAFWQYCGFQLIHIGSHINAETGCYTAMAILPLSKNAKQLMIRCRRKLERNWLWLKNIIPLPLSLPNLENQELTDDDWTELVGFAYAHRPLEASYAALCRLLLNSAVECPALKGTLQQHKSHHEMVLLLELTGKKALVQCWRKETILAMQKINQNKLNYWYNKLIFTMN